MNYGPDFAKKRLLKQTGIIFELFKVDVYSLLISGAL